MKSTWSDADAQAAIDHFCAIDPRCNEDLALRVYTSRLIGCEPSLVLHGGGNTSVKTTMTDDLGESVPVLCVKGSGWDLGRIEPPGLPAVRLGSLAALRLLDAMSDEDMVNAARTRLLDASAPNPSVETLLHAFLPHKFIDHSHADAILALVDQPHAEVLCRDVYGDSLAIVPYVMPGFQLAKLAATVYEANPQCEGLLLLQHGLFTFGDTARQSYERHIDAVSKAEALFASARGSSTVVREAAPTTRPYAELAPILRGRLGGENRRYVLTLRQGPAISRFLERTDLADVALRGPATPDHVIRTKQKPLLLEAQATPQAWAEHVDERLAMYRRAYREYYEAQTTERGLQRTALDPDPRVILVPGLGVITAGADLKAANIAADIYEHTIAVIEDAQTVGSYQPLADADLFDMEYWPLEQAKLGKSKPLPLQGRAVYVTGAASGIGAAVARRFAELGAQLFLVDRDAEALKRQADPLRAGWQAVDVTDIREVRASIHAAVQMFGGLDGVVSNAGTAPQAPIDACPPELLQASLDVNLLAHQHVAAAASAVLRAQGQGGFLLFNASKAAFNPGPGFGPYAIAKAALIALMRQYALELGPAKVRSNAINADRIRTGLFPDEMVNERARARGLAPDAYFRSNLLGREVTAADVADAFAALALAESTTGTVLTVDGGNIAAAPR